MVMESRQELLHPRPWKLLDLFYEPRGASERRVLSKQWPNLVYVCLCLRIYGYIQIHMDTYIIITHM